MAEAIALHQMKHPINTHWNKKPLRETENIVGIRVSGYRFCFYIAIDKAMAEQSPPVEPTELYQLKYENGLHFLIKDQRDMIIQLLSCIKEYISDADKLYYDRI